MSRILGLTDLRHASRSWHSEGAVIVLAAGAFDPLHNGHVQYFRVAREMGNVLIVSVASDHQVQQSKGDDRPRSPAEHRAGVVAAIRYVDAVVICDEPDVTQIIQYVQPHIYVKGSEYRSYSTPALNREAAAIEQIGGRLEFASGPVVCSSTAILAGV